jgi:hypothetical protein
MQKQYRQQGDPKHNDVADQGEGEKEASIALPPVDDLISAAEQAMKQQGPDQGSTMGFVCPMCRNSHPMCPARIYWGKVLTGDQLKMAYKLAQS